MLSPFTALLQKGLQCHNRQLFYRSKSWGTIQTENKILGTIGKQRREVPNVEVAMKGNSLHASEIFLRHVIAS